MEVELKLNMELTSLSEWLCGNKLEFEKDRICGHLASHILGSSFKMSHLFTMEMQRASEGLPNKHEFVR